MSKMNRSNRSQSDFLFSTDPSHQGVDNSDAGFYLPQISIQPESTGKESPLTKEMKRFNRLIKQLHEYEENQRKSDEAQEEYQRLHQSKVVPLLQEKAGVLLDFVLLIDQMIFETKLSKVQKRNVVMVVMTFLEEVTAHVPDSDQVRELLARYINLKVELMTRRDKKDLEDHVNANGYKVDMDNFSIEDIWEERAGQQKIHDEGFDGDGWWETSPKQSTRKDDLFLLDIRQLYKELAKVIHPDTEQNEQIRNKKEILMKELTEAKSQNDLFSMLKLKSKVHHLFKGQSVAIADLAQLKRYNKSLKSRLDEAKDRLIIDQMMQYRLNGQLGRTGLGGQRELDYQVRMLKTEIDSLRQDFRTLSRTQDLKGWIKEVVN